jgi:hypothetical protein
MRWGGERRTCTHLEYDPPEDDVPALRGVPVLIDGGCGHSTTDSLHDERYDVLRVRYSELRAINGKVAGARSIGRESCLGNVMKVS